MQRSSSFNKRTECIKQLKNIIDNIIVNQKNGKNNISSNNNNNNNTIHNIEPVKKAITSLLQVASELPFNEIGDFKEYISLLEILLGPILHEYYAFFNEDFKRNIFDSFFLPIHDNGNDGIASITLCFMGYANNFKSCIETNISNNSDEIDKTYIATELSRLFQKSFYNNNSNTDNKLHVLFQSILKINDQIFLKQFLNNIMSMPDRVCTLLVKSKKTPYIFFPKNYFDWVIDSFLSFLFITNIPDIDWKNTISNMFTKFITNGYTTKIVQCLMKQCLQNHELFINSSTKDTLLMTKRKQFLSKFSQLISCMELKILYKFLKELLVLTYDDDEIHNSNINNNSTSENNSMMMKKKKKKKVQLYEYIYYQVIKPILMNNNDILYMFQKQILLNQVIGKDGSKFCIKLLCIPCDKEKSQNKKRSIHTMTTFHVLVKLWSDSSFIYNSDYQQHLHITKLLMYILEWITGKDLEEYSILQLLLSGVQDHMEAELPKKSKLGMLVARKFSKILSMMDSLNFKESLTTEDTSMDSDIEQDIEIPSEAFDNINSAFRNNSKFQTSEKSLQAPQRQADIESDSDDESEDSSSDEDDGLIPYDISNETETLMSAKNEIIKTPLYIVDCIKGLTAKDDFNLYNISLEHLEKVIKRKDRGLKFYGIQLCNLLLRMDNKYNLETFDEIRSNALISLLVSIPEIVVEYLTQEFFRVDYGLTHRHLMLNTLLEGAKQLSNIQETKGLKQTGLNGNNADDAFITEKKLFDGTLVKTYKSTKPTIGKVVKRFKTTSAEQLDKLRGKTNLFNNYAGYFFFPLASRYDYKVRTLDLLGRDSRLLGSLLFVLGTFVELGCNSTVGPQMGATMLELVNALKEHPSHQVRRFLLYALSRVMLNIKLQLLQTWFVGSFEDIGSWLKYAAAKDSDDECRKRALAIIKSNIVPYTK